MEGQERPAGPVRLDLSELERVAGGAGGGNPALEGMLARVQEQRLATIEAQIGTVLAGLSDRGDWLDDADRVLRELRDDRPTEGEDAYGTFTDHDGQTQDVKAWLEASGIAVPDAGDDGTGTRQEFDATIAQLRQGIDDATSAQGLDLLRLQGLTAQKNAMPPLPGRR
ncbi:hypothetical protein G3576_01095 [Roseomonas stagni]|uniref:Uncharacterized protein n=1 Tax=Falsiroseomonas algicola TaxID=2716930 RepID=A0A6M1LE91_9PROT|nr:hypothetical protein [Falsiroseomonas algicola]NGM18590.1 hypothetical protein [Falsiroseomonas algicola]